MELIYGVDQCRGACTALRPLFASPNMKIAVGSNHTFTEGPAVKISRRDFLGTAGVLAVLGDGGVAIGADARWQPPKKRPIKVLENVWIPMRSGRRLAMRLWLPEDAERDRVPVVMEYYPYRKRDMMRKHDQTWGDAFTPYGFAYARVDIRGSGESDGVLVGEYLQSEQDDAVEAIAWLARQPWCNGSVGMRGISWGGFNALQIAARAPPALKAIVTECATDNRYTDDAHYVGGSPTFDGIEWGGEFKNVMVAPPDPAIVGEDRWRQMWMQRLEATPPVAAEWLSHQTYDAFWQHGSVATDYASIKCPVYAVDGQVDSYRDFLSRVLTNLKVPRKGLIGSWAHREPEEGDPGPGLDWAYEEARWFTHWLKGIDTGVMGGPMIRAYMETQTASEVWPKDVPGHWVSEETWPSPRIRSQPWFLNAGGLSLTRDPESKTLTCKSQETVGITKREWYPNDLSVDLPPDQTPDDRRSVVFDSAPLEADLEIMGNPVAVVRLASDQPVAKLAVRINEVYADGKSWNVSYGVLNLTHREGHEHPRPLTPGQVYDVRVSCYFATHRFKKGSRIRVALTESLWPMVWPSPRPVTLTLQTAESHLLLPVRPPRLHESMPSPAMLIGVAQRNDATDEQIQTTKVTQSGADASGFVSIRKDLPQPPYVVPGAGTTLSGNSVWIRSIREGDPNSGLWSVEWEVRMQRGTWDVRTLSTIELRSTAEEFHVKESLAAWDGGKQVFQRSWDKRIKRELT